jgi:hypothetical protein
MRPAPVISTVSRQVCGQYRQIRISDLPT